MMLPALNAEKQLPIGVHPATLSEVLKVFGEGSTQRRAVGLRLKRIYELARATGQLARFIVFGSFVTGKEDPNDVDVLIVMCDSFDLTAVRGEAAIVFQHLEAERHFGASIFWLRRMAALGGEEAMVQYWQVRRDGGRRGIVEIVPESP
ncbi:MAG: hypothetical protein AB7U73_08180 [Pirellulales bacterium]